MTTTAHEVVASYLHDKADRDRPKTQRELVAKRTHEIVDELPDGFTVKDVRECVKVLTRDEPVLDDMADPKRNRMVTKTLGELVADDVLKLDGLIYSHTDPTQRGNVAPIR